MNSTIQNTSLLAKDDKWVKCISGSGYLKATAVVAPFMIESSRQKHHLNSPKAITAFGEALMAGLLLASTCKEKEKITLSVQSSLYLRKAVIDATPSGTVRGFLVTAPDLSPDSEESLLGPWLNGLLSVTRLKRHLKEPYTGTVACGTGFLAKDLTFYLSQSEQIPSSVGIFVNVSPTGSVQSAAAFLLQVMPGANEDEILLIEDNIRKMKTLGDHITPELTPVALLGHLLNDLSFNLIDERSLRYYCNCSKDRVLRALRTLGHLIIDDMIQKDKGAKIDCDFCGQSYLITEAELQRLL